MNTKLSALLICLLFLIPGSDLLAQVVIGMDEAPSDGSILQLKTIKDDISNGDVNATKGFSLPRVKLTSTYDLFPMYMNNATYTGTAKTALDLVHKGMMVYNVGGTGALTVGMYFWDGTQWMIFDSTVSIPATIVSILCESVTFDKQTLENGVPFETFVRVPYTGGNGAIYPQGEEIDCDQPQAGETLVTGLKIQLQAGKLASGVGELVYRIWGTPVGNSPDVARFHISFFTSETTIVECDIEIGNTAFARVDDLAVVGPLIYTEDNNVSGYGRSITSPDGKWSVRVFVPTPGVNYTSGYLEDGITPIGGNGNSPILTTFEEVDLQLRPNDMEDETIRIMWAAKILYRADNTLGHTSIIDLPKASCNNLWGGTTVGAGDLTAWDYWYILGPTTTAPAVQYGKHYAVGWYNTNVFQGGFPELREYLWTRIDDTALSKRVKTVYKVTFSMGALTTGLPTAAALTYVTAANAEKTTVYLKMEQTTSIE